MATTKRKISMRDFLKIKAFIAAGSFEEDFSSLDDEFLDSVSYMSIYLPKGKEQAILDFINKNNQDRKMADLKTYAEFLQFKAMKNKQKNQPQATMTMQPMQTDMFVQQPQQPRRQETEEEILAQLHNHQ